MNDLHNWHRFWLIWFCASFFTFLAAEVYALVTDYRKTLSETIWWIEGYKSGADFADVSKWTAGHFLLGGAFGVVFIWLIGHFIFRWWH